ncbi:MAG: CehA/McbA family metallohydrolase [Candidatus Brocadiia bacterium]
MHDLKGCLHVHSSYSDGDEPVAHILQAARQTGLDYLVLTDHETTLARDDGWEGWHNGVLVVVGAEVQTGHHHCLALGIDHSAHAPRRDTAQQLAAIKQQGGLAFVAHPHPVHKPLFKLWVPGWDEWELDDFDGVEIWPFLHDWISDLHPWNFFSHVRDPDRWVTGPDPELLGRWDAVGRRRRLVGIGSLDNHARRLPFGRYGPALMTIFPHRYAFRTVRTHLLANEPLSGEAADLATVRGLLGRGRCYVSYDLLADATGFRFMGRRPEGEDLQMGDEAPAAGPVAFRVASPLQARLSLLRDGQPLATTVGRELEATDDRPGVYRVEARLGPRPWVFTNPIYLREPT